MACLIMSRWQRSRLRRLDGFYLEATVEFGKFSPITSQFSFGNKSNLTFGPASVNSLFNSVMTEMQGGPSTAMLSPKYIVLSSNS